MYVADKFRRMNIPFEEEIDEAYVLGNDESFHPKQSTPKRGVKNIARQYLDEAINQAIDYASDPDNVKKAIRFGIEIVVDRLK